LIKTTALRGDKPGLGPAAEILSLRRQSKYSKKGDPGVAAPAGFPFVQYKKWEGPKLACGSDKRSFFFHFLYRTNGVYTWELRKNKIKSNNNVNTASNHIANSVYP